MKPGIDIEVREVGLRDGLQIIPTFFATEGKIAWIKAEAAAGVPEIEVCSFVPPKVSAQFVDHAETIPVALAQPGLTVAALVPNLKGAERGFQMGVHKMNFVLSASESHNMANVRCTTDESLERLRQILELRNATPENRKVRIGAGISTALGCTIEGRVDPKQVYRIATAMLEMGVDEISVADTVGYANPNLVREVFTETMKLAGKVPVAAHFHDTRGLGLANVLAALDVGCRRFDASLAGLGGCPFAPGATGNVVMDDMVFLFESMGLKTGVDLEKLVAVREIVAKHLPDEKLYGGIARAGLPKGFRPASQMMQAAE
jgi:hydroxymethylglutaryl-CoA lyase